MKKILIAGVLFLFLMPGVPRAEEFSAQYYDLREKEI